jgi:hypothetical protein
VARGAVQRLQEGITSAGVQLSNVKLPPPPLLPGYPIQPDARHMPARGVGLIIATDTDPRLSHDRVARLPLPAPNDEDWDVGSVGSAGNAPSDGPWVEGLWFRFHGKTFFASAKIGPKASKSDLRAVAAIVHSLR